MGNLLEYSGIVTKIRAMKAKLLTPKQFEEIASLGSVPEIAEYLKKNTAYADVLAMLDESQIHRGNIEKVLTQSLYRDYTKIYRFCGQKQRRFMKLLVKNYEIDLINYCLRIVINRYKQPFDLNYKRAFFDRYSQISIEKLITSRTTDELVENLKGTEYYQPLNHLREIESPTLFDYETALDIFNFRNIWTLKDKLFHDEDLKGLTNAYGHKFDLLNLQWIRRSREFYQATPADIYALLLPVHYKLKKEEITALVEAENNTVFEDVLSRTYYGKHYPQLSADTLEDMYISIMKRVLTRSAKSHPFSAATIYQYLFFKDHEIRRLTVALECIRYSVPPEETVAHIFKF